MEICKVFLHTWSKLSLQQNGEAAQAGWRKLRGNAAKGCRCKPGDRCRFLFFEKFFKILKFFAPVETLKKRFSVQGVLAKDVIFEGILS